MTWMVTGGAGYLGAHTVLALRAAGHRVVALDNMTTGIADRLPDDVPLVVGSVSDRRLVVDTLVKHRVTGVVHLAALKSAPESVRSPGLYKRANIGGLATLLSAMPDAGVRSMVFASSAAVYGDPGVRRVTEATPAASANPYGHTKLLGEQLLANAGINWIALRYFNAAGAAHPDLVDHGMTNLVPHVFRAVTHGQPITVAGTDYDTEDGTGVRDYVHAADIAAANLAAVNRLSVAPAAAVYNVGGGRGHSVLDVLAAVERVTGRRVPRVLGPRRPGDAAEVVAGVTRIHRELGWSPTRGLEEIVASEWRAREPVSVAVVG